MNCYDYHSDGDSAEKGGAYASITRTVIICFDRGYVNFQVAGYEPILYDTLLAPNFIEMPPDVVHRSKITAPPTVELGFEAGCELVQRKLVIHMGPLSSSERVVDWTARVAFGRSLNRSAASGCYFLFLVSFRRDHAHLRAAFVLGGWSVGAVGRCHPFASLRK